MKLNYSTRKEFGEHRDFNFCVCVRHGNLGIAIEEADLVLNGGQGRTMMTAVFSTLQLS